jgi:hypothetical protein
MTFEERIEFLCNKMCDELDLDPTKVPESYKFKPMIRDWLINEAFRKIRNNFWNGNYKEKTVDTHFDKSPLDGGTSGSTQ